MKKSNKKFKDMNKREKIFSILNIICIIGLVVCGFGLVISCALAKDNSNSSANVAYADNKIDTARFPSAGPYPTYSSIVLQTDLPIRKVLHCDFECYFVRNTSGSAAGSLSYSSLEETYYEDVDIDPMEDGSDNVKIYLPGVTFSSEIVGIGVVIRDAWDGFCYYPDFSVNCFYHFVDGDSFFYPDSPYINSLSDGSMGQLCMGLFTPDQLPSTSVLTLGIIGWSTIDLDIADTPICGFMLQYSAPSYRSFTTNIVNSSNESVVQTFTVTEETNPNLMKSNTNFDFDTSGVAIKYPTGSSSSIAQDYFGWPNTGDYVVTEIIFTDGDSSALYYPTASLQRYSYAPPDTGDVTMIVVYASVYRPVGYLQFNIFDDNHNQLYQKSFSNRALEGMLIRIDVDAWPSRLAAYGSDSTTTSGTYELFEMLVSRGDFPYSKLTHIVIELNSEIIVDNAITGVNSYDFLPDFTESTYQTVNITVQGLTEATSTYFEIYNLSGTRIIGRTAYFYPVGTYRWNLAYTKTQAKLTLYYLTEAGTWNVYQTYLMELDEPYDSKAVGYRTVKSGSQVVEYTLWGTDESSSTALPVVYLVYPENLYNPTPSISSDNPYHPLSVLMYNFFSSSFFGINMGVYVGLLLIIVLGFTVFRLLGGSG